MSSSSVMGEITVCESRIQGLEQEKGLLKKLIAQQEDSQATYARKSAKDEEMLCENKKRFDTILIQKDTVKLARQLDNGQTDLMGKYRDQLQKIEEIKENMKRILMANYDKLGQLEQELQQEKSRLDRLWNDYHNERRREEEAARAAAAAEVAQSKIKH